MTYFGLPCRDTRLCPNGNAEARHIRRHGHANPSRGPIVLRPSWWWRMVQWLCALWQMIATAMRLAWVARTLPGSVPTGEYAPLLCAIFEACPTEGLTYPVWM